MVYMIVVSESAYPQHIRVCMRTLCIAINNNYIHTGRFCVLLEHGIHTKADKQTNTQHTNIYCVALVITLK